MFDFRGVSDIVYISIIIFLFIYFCTLFVCGMAGFGLEWFMKHDDTIQLINRCTQVLFFVRFYFLWNLSIRDFSEEISRYDTKPDYPQWSWDWIQVKNYWQLYSKTREKEEPWWFFPYDTRNTMIWYLEHIYYARSV